MRSLAHDAGADPADAEDVSAAEGYESLLVQHAQYEEVPQRRRDVSTRTAALLGFVALAAVGYLSWSRLTLSKAAAVNTSGRAFLEADADASGRACQTIEGMRAVDGIGPLAPQINVTFDECLEACRTNTKCKQAVYSHFGGGCYMFQGQKSGLSFGPGFDPATFHSVYCEDVRAELRLTMMLEHAWDCNKKHEKAQIREQWAAAEKKAKALVANLSMENKMSFVHGSDGGMGYAGFLRVEGLPETVVPLKMQDGPQGFNPYQESLAGTATQFPALLSVAASFNPEIARAYSAAVADEFVTKGANVLLGPDVEVTRATLTGRCFETISGEDPYLGSQLVQPFVKEIQARGIIATVKHWLDNNQEIYRQTMNAIVPERAQHEIYMPVFKAAFEAGAGAVMCSYNNVAGAHACESSYLLQKLLRDEIGFKGYVVSDWGATHDSEASALNGLDIEMPTGQYFGALPEFIANGTIGEEVLDEKVTHVLSAMYFAGQFDGRFPISQAGALGHMPATSDQHRAVALQTILESAVLLKNDGNLLPLTTAGKKIALVGQYCNQTYDKRFSQGSVYSGGGSGYVMTTRTITPAEGLTTLITDANQIYWTNDTVANAAGADVAIVCAAAHAEEGWDRPNLTLPEAQTILKQLRKLPGGKDQKIIILVSTPGAVTTEWLKDADAALVMFEPGEQVGVALAQLVSGQASPTGRLPVSFPEVNENRFTPYQYPGLCADNSWCLGLIANFSEDVLVGYRWNEAMKVPSAFPFGFGLSYSKFKFSALQTECTRNSAAVAFTVSNIGDREDTAVPQLYVSFPSLLPVVKQLRGFRKVPLAAGARKSIAFVLSAEDWSYFDEGKGEWVSALKKGEEVTVHVGFSVTDIALTATLPCN